MRIILQILFSTQTAVFLLLLAALYPLLKIVPKDYLDLKFLHLEKEGDFLLPLAAILALFLFNRLGYLLISAFQQMGGKKKKDKGELDLSETEEETLFFESEPSFDEPELPKERIIPPPRYLIAAKEEIKSPLPNKNITSLLELVGYKVRDIEPEDDSESKESGEVEKIEAKKGMSLVFPILSMGLGIALLAAFAFLAKPQSQEFQGNTPVKLKFDNPKSLNFLPSPAENSLKIQSYSLITISDTVYKRNGEVNVLERAKDFTLKFIENRFKDLKKLSIKSRQLELVLADDSHEFSVKPSSFYLAGDYLVFINNTSLQFQSLLDGKELVLKLGEKLKLSDNTVLTLYYYDPQCGVKAGLSEKDKKKVSPICIPLKKGSAIQLPSGQKLALFSPTPVLTITYLPKSYVAIGLVGLFLFILGIALFWLPTRLRIFGYFDGDTKTIISEGMGIKAKPIQLLEKISETISFEVSTPSRKSPDEIFQELKAKVEENERKSSIPPSLAPRQAPAPPPPAKEEPMTLQQLRQSLAAGGQQTLRKSPSAPVQPKPPAQTPPSESDKISLREFRESLAKKDSTVPHQPSLAPRKPTAAPPPSEKSKTEVDLKSKTTGGTPSRPPAPSPQPTRTPPSPADRSKGPGQQPPSPPSRSGGQPLNTQKRPTSQQTGQPAPTRQGAGSAPQVPNQQKQVGQPVPGRQGATGTQRAPGQQKQVGQPVPGRQGAMGTQQAPGQQKQTAPPPSGQQVPGRGQPAQKGQTRPGAPGQPAPTGTKAPAPAQKSQPSRGLTGPKVQGQPGQQGGKAPSDKAGTVGVQGAAKGKQVGTPPGVGTPGKSPTGTSAPPSPQQFRVGGTAGSSSSPGKKSPSGVGTTPPVGGGGTTPAKKPSAGVGTAPAPGSKVEKSEVRVPTTRDTTPDKKILDSFLSGERGKAGTSEKKDPSGKESKTDLLDSFDITKPDKKSPISRKAEAERKNKEAPPSDKDDDMEGLITIKTKSKWSKTATFDKEDIESEVAKLESTGKKSSGREKKSSLDDLFSIDEELDFDKLFDDIDKDSKK